MGFWHTGYAEFHEPTGLEGFVYSPPPPVRYVCEICAASFLELAALRRHRFESHPLRQPALLLRGRAVGALPVTVLSALGPTDIVVEDATHCTLNQRSLTLPELGLALAQMSREYVELELMNGGATTRCTLDFRIADEKHLFKVEEAFLRMARDHVLTIDSIGRFTQDCRPFDDAMPYCDGICHYLYGVMAKEKSPESGLRPSQYAERFVRASDELSGFDRTLARSIRALIAFHFNQFEEASSLAPRGSSLSHCARAFAGLLQGHPWDFLTVEDLEAGAMAESLLTDQDTLQILGDSRDSLRELIAHSDELLEHLNRATAGYDRLKRLMLAGEALSQMDNSESQLLAKKLAREAASQPDSRVWAESLIERMKPI